jgi:hypothetical protein
LSDRRSTRRRVGHRGIPGPLGRDDYIWLFRELPSQLEAIGEIEVGGSSPAGSAQGMYWWRYYELPFTHQIAVLCRLMKWEEALRKAGDSENPTKAFLAFAKLEMERNDYSALDASPPSASLVANLAIGFGFSLVSIATFGLSINELLEKARLGNVRALRDAISIDKTVAATATGAAVIALAQLAGDNKTLRTLFKRRKPDGRRELHQELRFMRRVFAEVGALDGGVTDSVIKLITDDLKAYPTVGGDAAKNIRQLFDSYKKEAAI